MLLLILFTKHWKEHIFKDFLLINIWKIMQFLMDY